MLEAVPMVRCRLGGLPDGDPSGLRYVPLAEFELWRHLMESRHKRHVVVEAVSVWLAEDAATWNSGYSPEELEPVLRVHLDLLEPHGVMRPVDRFFPAETYPQAQEALLSHYEGPARPRRVVATPGYFIPPEARVAPRTKTSIA